MRVYTKAKELGVTSRSLLDYLAIYGCELPSASCSLSEDALDLIPTQFIGAINEEARFSRRPDDLPSHPPWPQLVTGYQASQIAQVSPATIRQWVKRGHLGRAELRGHSRSAVYCVDDVLAARLTTRQAQRDKIPVYRVPRLTSKTFDTCMSARDAAAYLNIPESTIRSWVHRKRIVPAAYDGRSPQYRLSAIYRLIQDRRRPELDPTVRTGPATGAWDD